MLPDRLGWLISNAVDGRGISVRGPNKVRLNDLTSFLTNRVTITDTIRQIRLYPFFPRLLSYCYSTGMMAWQAWYDVCCKRKSAVMGSSSLYSGMRTVTDNLATRLLDCHLTTLLQNSPSRARLAALPRHLNRTAVRRDGLMKTADVEATYLSELQFMVQCVAKAVVGDMLLILLMIATLVI